MSTYYLLIQGPIISSGRTGLTSFNKEVTKDSIVNYNCENNIIKLLTNFSGLFKEVLIITWIDEEINEINFKPFQNCRIIKLKNITPELKIGNKNLPTDFNNKHKQFYALSKGLELIESKDDEYIIKIRTDQYLNIDVIIKEHQIAITKKEKSKNKIFVPFINVLNYHVSDFYFIATKQILSDFSNSMLWNSYIEFNSSVHLDMSLKYAYLHHRKKAHIPISTYFINSFTKNPNRNKIKLQNYLSENVYGVLSSEIFENIVWRGDLIKRNPEVQRFDIFSNKNVEQLITDERKYKKFTLKDFLYINIPSYIFVRVPCVKNTFIKSFIKKTYQIFTSVLKKKIN